MNVDTPLSPSTPNAAAAVCVECEDQPSAVYCEQCLDDFCEVCFGAQHRKGTRSSHFIRRLAPLHTESTHHSNQNGSDGATAATKGNRETAKEFLASLRFRGSGTVATTATNANTIATTATTDGKRTDTNGDDLDVDVDALPSEEAAIMFRNAVSAAIGGSRNITIRGTKSPVISPSTTSLSTGAVGTWFLDRAKYIPLRLTLDERKYLRLLEAALNVSEYTDKIDVLIYSNKPKRIVAQIKELCAILSGLTLAADYKAGQELFEDRDFETNAAFFQNVFELGRRHKIMNPEKMRSTYGKLVYLLQDAQMGDVSDMLQFTCVKPIRTVYRVLEECRGDAVVVNAGNSDVNTQSAGAQLLQDDLVAVATMEILSDGKTRHQVQTEIKLKERAIETLVRKYSHCATNTPTSSSPGLSPELIRQCLYSIGDNHAFLRVNRDPCDKMIDYLQTYFDPTRITTGFSLSIQTGHEGARLSHNHEKQYQYVLQSLTLWREVLHDMFMLWTLAEDDLLDDTNPYRLRDTGQGLNRVQSAPRVSRMMHTILARAQRRAGFWVGSSVVHMGDHNVPNALMFIDKYTQIHRILLPIVTTLGRLPDLVRNDNAIRNYIDAAYDGVSRLTHTILCDFYRHAFDGSGADNFFDAGSCIDGRLTSAWNWCSQLEKKPYFPVFLLTGFMGFDGRFE